MDKTNKNINKEKSFSISRYAFQNFKHYGGKSIILMIVLAVTLVLSLLNISTSLQGTVYLQAVTIGGDAQFKYDNITPEQINLLKEQKKVEWTSEYIYLSNLWAAKTEDDETYNKIELMYIENLKQMEGFKLQSGVAPQKENEVAIPPYVAEYLGIEAKVGAEFEVNLESYGLVNEDMRTNAVLKSEKFVVSGIIQDNIYFKLDERYFMFVSKDFVIANSESDNYSLDAFVKLKKGYEAAKVAPEIADKIGVAHDNIQYNNFYLVASLNNTGDRIFFYVIIAFFTIVGAIIIYNAFNIVIAKRTRHFGLLTLIGASKKQIRKCVYAEALLNTAVALPVGLLLGTFLSWLIMPVVRASYDRVSSVFSVELWSYLLTALITVIMVFTGAIIPARRAGKITPVEAAKFSPNSTKMRKKSGKVKDLKNITLLSLARINLFRKKGGAGGVVTSLSIVGVLFIGLSFILFSTYYSLGNLARRELPADITVLPGIIDKNDIRYSGMLRENAINQIMNLDGIKESHVLYYQTYQVEGIGDSVEIFDGVEYVTPSTGYIFGVDDELMRKYLKNNDLSLFENPANVLVFRSRFAYENVDVFPSFQNAVLDIYPEDDDTPAGQITVNITATSDDYDRSVPSYINISGQLPTLVMPLSSFKTNNLNMRCYAVYLDTDKAKYNSIIESLDKICESEGNIHYRSITERKKEYETQMVSILALIFAGLGVVFLVSVLNLVSTTFIGIDQRKKELGILSALGLGRKELKKMLKWEGIWVSVFSSIISIAGGFGMGWLFYVWIDSMMYGDNYIELYFPAVPIIIFCLIYIFAPYIISSIAVRRLLKNTTVELIGQEV